MPERKGRSKDGRGKRGGSENASGNGRGEGGRGGGPRPFWSGTLTFGLVSVPVQLHAGNRSAGVSLRMVDEDGTPLSRRYICPKEDREVGRDELVRGYPIGEDRFVVVSDEELEELEPKKSREIDLRRFVPLEQLDPVFFERAYILTPAEGSAKAYRLLAHTMEKTGRAGVATFVMRSKEYLVAIVAEHGILRAETMRFHDEVRSVDDIGLPEMPKPSKERVRALARVMKSAAADALEPDELEDRRTREIEALVERKRKKGEGVKEVAAAASEEDEDEVGRGDIIDLMAVLRRSLERASEGEEAGEGASGKKPGRKPPARAGRRGTRGGADELEGLTKAELYERARALDVPGRSQMSREELLAAVRAARRSA